MRFDPIDRLAGDLAPPPDKSISHRAAIVGAMSDGPVRVRGYLRSADTSATLEAVAALGARLVDVQPRGGGLDLELVGAGLRGADPSAAAIDVGNSGTLIRVLPGWLAGQPRGRWVLHGDDSVARRPVDRVVHPLRRMGATVDCRDGGLPPIVVEGSDLHGVVYELPVASAQVKSSVLLAGLLAEGDTTVVEPLSTRDHTEIMLRTAGAGVHTEDGRVTVGPQRGLELGEVDVPGDFSSAAFFIVAATLVPGSELRLRGVGVNPTRTGFLRVLERMGGEVEVDQQASSGGEPAAHIVVRSGRLRGTAVEPEEVPLTIDELPLVALLGAFAEGTTIVRGAQELRRKESDRVTTVVDGLRGLGARIEAAPDGFVVAGGGELQGGTIDARGDHRIAMLGAVAGMVSRAGVEVEGFEAAAVSYPTFADDLRRLV
ncbi:MAG: 3-phosphoshikimate 1-carboxyvinyltransferase [Solirubrobacterales bacterium]